MHAASRHRWKSWIAPALIALAVLVAQLCVIDAYGATWDEPLHRNWAKQFVLFWQTGDGTYLQEMPGKGMYYGPGYFLANYGTAQFASHVLGFPFTPANHLLGIIVTSIAAGFLFAFVRAAAGARLAWLSTLFAVTYPHLIAHAQYNPKDIPVLVASLPMFAAVHRTLVTRSKRWALAAGLLYGVCLAAKLSAIAMLPILAVILGAAVIRDVRGGGDRAAVLRRDGALLALCAFGAVLGMYATWPTLWFRPLLIVDSLHVFLLESFWPGKVLYFGTEYPGADLPWHYMPFQFFLATPLPAFAAFLLGSVLAFRRALRSERWAFYVVVLAWFWVPLVLTLKPGLVRYDGIRQLLFCVPALAILAGMGLEWLMDIAGRKLSWKYAPIVLVVAVFGWLGAEVVRVHPFQGSYVNESIRLAIPKDIHDTFEIEFWGASYRQAHDWIVQNVQAGDIVCVPIADYLVTWYRWPDGIRFGCTDDATYVMYFSRYSKEYRKRFEKLNPVYEIERYGTPLLQIYKVR